MGTFYKAVNNGAWVVYTKDAYRRELDRNEARVAYTSAVGRFDDPDDMPPPRYGEIAVFRKELVLPPRWADRDELRTWALEGDGRFAGTLDQMNHLIEQGGHTWATPMVSLYVPFSNNNPDFWEREVPYLMTPEMVERMFAPDPGPELFSSTPSGPIV